MWHGSDEDIGNDTTFSETDKAGDIAPVNSCDESDVHSSASAAIALYKQLSLTDNAPVAPLEYRPGCTPDQTLG